MPLRPYQQQTIDQLLHLLRSPNRIPHCVFGPTGSGKSHIIREFIAQAHVPTVVYTNRKLLFEQIRDHLAAAGVVVGLRAAGHDKRLLEDVQVAMVQSETKRVTGGQHSMHNAKLVIVDECFTGDTEVLTPMGSRRIDIVRSGDKIFCAAGIGTVEAVSCRSAKSLYRVEFSNGTHLDCTGNHKIFTNDGWVEARSMEVGSLTYSPQDVRHLWNSIHTISTSTHIQKKAVVALWSKTGSRVSLEPTIDLLGVLCQEIEESNEPSRVPVKTKSDHEKIGPQTMQSRGERAATALGSIDTVEIPGRRVESGTSRANKDVSWQRLSNSLQNRHCQPELDDRNRSRRTESQYSCSTIARRQKNSSSGQPRVVNISRLKSDRDVPVYNLRISGHPSYFANGHLVHNCHDNCQGNILSLCEKHRNQGALLVGFTATPLDINHLYKRIIVSVTYDECYRNGWLLPCHIYEVQRPDNKWIKKVPVGEVLIKGEYREEFRQQIVGRVLSSYRRLNPLGVPTLLFAPDRPSATWFAEQFCEDGIPAASIDGQQCWVDGREYKGTKKREEIIRRLKDRDLKVVCNRFVLTTGVDIPEVGHGICATPYGSVKVFRQAFGRILRPHPTLNSVSWIDHGGNPFRLGDPRVDIDWSQTPTDLVIQDTIKERMKSKPESEPIICPNCHQMRFPGEDQEYNLVCPSCGWAAKGRVHNVLQVDGTLLRKTGYYYPKRRVANPSLCDKWRKCFYRCRTSGRTIAQAKALFKYENFCEPDPSWPLMPKRMVDLRRKIKDIPKEHLVEDSK